MESWIKKAVEYLPEFEDLLTEPRRLPGPTSIWNDLYLQLLAAYDESPVNDDLVGRIYDFASWCLRQPDGVNADADISSAVAVAFIESLPLDTRVALDLHRWMSVEAFKGFENLFRYHLDDEEYKKFCKEFLSRKTASNPPPRI